MTHRTHLQLNPWALAAALGLTAFLIQLVAYISMVALMPWMSKMGCCSGAMVGQGSHPGTMPLPHATGSMSGMPMMPNVMPGSMMGMGVGMMIAGFIAVPLFAAFFGLFVAWIYNFIARAPSGEPAIPVS